MPHPGCDHRVAARRQPGRHAGGQSLTFQIRLETGAVIAETVTGHRPAWRRQVQIRPADTEETMKTHHPDTLKRRYGLRLIQLLLIITTGFAACGPAAEPAAPPTPTPGAPAQSPLVRGYLVA